VAQIDALAGIAHPDLWPDLTLLLDLPVDAGLARAALRNGDDGPDRFESEQRAFFERVRDTYLARARQEPRRFQVIDAARSVDDVSADLRAAVERLLAGTE
jgi:dTMP kinase